MVVITITGKQPNCIRNSQGDNSIDTITNVAKSYANEEVGAQRQAAV